MTKTKLRRSDFKDYPRPIAVRFHETNSGYTLRYFGANEVIGKYMDKDTAAKHHAMAIEEINEMMEAHRYVKEIYGIDVMEEFRQFMEIKDPRFENYELPERYTTWQELRACGKTRT